MSDTNSANASKTKEIKENQPVLNNNKTEEDKPISAKKTQENSFFIQNLTTLLNRFVSALVLIFLGLLLLGNTTGRLGWGIWFGLLQLWPVFIVLVGVNLILGLNKFSKLLVPIINFLVVVLLAIFLILAGNQVPLSATSKWLIKTEEYSLSKEKTDLAEFEKQNFKLEFNGGTATILEKPKAKAFEIQSQKYLLFGQTNQPKIDYSVENKVLNLDLKTATDFDFLAKQDSTNPTKVYLTNVPTNIDTTVNAGNLQGNFSLINIENFKTKLNTGETKISFTQNALPKQFDLEINAGYFELTLLGDTGYKINYELNAGTLEAENQNLDTSNTQKVFESSNFNQSNIKTEINLKVNAGKFRLIRN